MARKNGHESVVLLHMLVVNEVKKSMRQTSQSDNQKNRKGLSQPEENMVQSL